MPYLRSNLVALAPRLLRHSSLPCLHHRAYAEMVNMYYLTIVKTLRRQPFLIGDLYHRHNTLGRCRSYTGDGWVMPR